MSVFTDHIVHHLLSIYALGASPSQLEEAYRNNTGYQLPTPPADLTNIENLSHPEGFAKHLGDSECYRDYVIFFQKLVAEHGVESVVNEYVFKGDARADDMLARMFSGMFLWSGRCPQESAHSDFFFFRIFASHHTSGVWARIQSTTDRGGSFGTSCDSSRLARTVSLGCRGYCQKAVSACLSNPRGDHG